MLEFCRLRCDYAELHAPSSFGLDELLVQTLYKLSMKLSTNAGVTQLLRVWLFLYVFFTTA